MVSIPVRKFRRRNEFSLSSTSQGDTPSPRLLTGEQNPFDSAIRDQIGNERKKYSSFGITQFIIGLSKWKHVDRAVMLLLGFMLGIGYFVQVRNSFENLTHFSHLSNVERELTLPNEVAFRYTFYKKIAGAKSLTDGIRAVLDDKGTKWPETTNAFRHYFLTPEAVAGGSYHLIKKFISLRNLSTCYEPIAQEQVLMVLDESEESNSINDITRPSCSGLGNPMYFYFNWIWMLESCSVGLLVYFGFELSNSYLGGVMTGLVFIITHPQRSNSDWIFPSQVKLEWMTFLLQTYLISALVLRKTHPPWITVLDLFWLRWVMSREGITSRASAVLCVPSKVKIGISSAVLILTSQKEAQWLLLSQLLILMLMEIWGHLSPYVASLVIFGQITGWQYASLVHLDTSFSNWSFYLYTLMSVIITLYLVQPLLDWLLGARRQKWIFLRRTFLLIAFQMTLIIVWTEMTRKLGLPEDARFVFPGPSSPNNPIGGKMSDADIIRLRTRSSGEAFRSRDQLNQSQEKFSGLELERENDIVNTSAENGAGLPGSGFHQGESAEILNRVYACFYHNASQIPLELLLRKYFFHGLGILYFSILCIFSASIIESGRMGAKGLEQDMNFSPRNSSKLKLESGKLNSASVKSSKKSAAAVSEAAFPVIRGESGLITFNFLQALFFLLFTICLDGKWELLLTTQLCLLLALLFHVKTVGVAYQKLSSQFGIGIQVHWIGILGLSACLIATGKLGSEQMYRNSRGWFELGNPRVTQLLETVKWIKGNTNGSTCGLLGLESHLLPLHLTTARACVNHNHYHDIHFIMASQPAAIEPARASKTGESNKKIRSRYADPLIQRMERKSIGLSESQVLSRVYSMFRTDCTIEDYHALLAPLRATHLVLSKQHCAHPSTKAKGKQGYGFEEIPGFYGQESEQHDSAFNAYPFEGKQLYSEERSCKCDLSHLWDPNHNSGQGPTAWHSSEEYEKPEILTTLPVSGNSIRNKEKASGEHRTVVNEELLLDVPQLPAAADTVHSRLLSQRNIKPFTKVFENQGYMILSLFNDLDSKPVNVNISATKKAAKKDNMH